MAYNETVMDHVNNIRNAGPLDDATHEGTKGVPGGGRYIKINLLIEDDTIKKATYQCNGCPSSIASASVLCQVATGKHTDFAEVIEGEDVITLLDGLPEGKGEVAQMAVEALRLAVQGKFDTTPKEQKKRNDNSLRPSDR